MLIVSFSMNNLSPSLRLSERHTISTMLMGFRSVLVLLVPVILAGGAMAADAGTCSLLLPSRRCCFAKQFSFGSPCDLIETVMSLKLIGLLEVLNTVSLITKGYINAYAGVTYFMFQLIGTLKLTVQRGYCVDRMAEGLLTPAQGNLKDTRLDKLFQMFYFGWSETTRIEMALATADGSASTVATGPRIATLTQLCGRFHANCTPPACPHYCIAGNAALYNNSVRNAEMCLLRMVENDLKNYIDGLARSRSGTAVKILTSHIYTPNGYASGYPLLPGKVARCDEMHASYITSLLMQFDVLFALYGS